MTRNYLSLIVITKLFNLHKKSLLDTNAADSLLINGQKINL